MSNSKIGVPDNLLLDKNAKCNEIYLYVILKMVSFDKGKVSIYTSNLMDKLGWKDNKTLKKYLGILKDKQYIDYEFNDLPRNGKLEIIIRGLRIGKSYLSDEKEYYTSLSRKTINKIIECAANTVVKSKSDDCTDVNYVDLKESSVRLYFYYKKKYKSDLGYAYPSYSMINSETGIRNKNIKAINNNFRKHGLIEIEIGNKNYSDDYERVIRERNKYIPLWN